MRNLSTEQPDRRIDHDRQPGHYDEAELNAPQVVTTVLGTLGRRKSRRKTMVAGTS